jgi:hypothetical protein
LLIKEPLVYLKMNRTLLKFNRDLKVLIEVCKCLFRLEVYSHRLGQCINRWSLWEIKGSGLEQWEKTLDLEQAVNFQEAVKTFKPEHSPVE